MQDSTQLHCYNLVKSLKIREHPKTNSLTCDPCCICEVLPVSPLHNLPSLEASELLWPPC